jgi:hypothetical protein
MPVYIYNILNLLYLSGKPALIKIPAKTPNIRHSTHPGRAGQVHGLKREIKVKMGEAKKN